MSKDSILVVDDDESILEYLAMLLAMENYQVETVSTATVALAKIKAAPSRFPVVLSDIMMPGVNGLELLKFIHGQNPDTAVIMMTAHSSMETAIHALNEGAYAYLPKPINEEELRIKVANAFEKYHLLEKNRELVSSLSQEKDFNEHVLRNLLYTVVATDSQGNIKKANKAMEDLLGYTEQDLLGKPLSVILSSANNASMQGQLQQKKTVSDLPLVFRTKSGSDVSVLFTGTIMRDDQGIVIGFLGTAKK